jgi:hypothetical protein
MNKNSMSNMLKEYVEVGIRKEGEKVAASYKEQMLEDLDGAIDSVIAKTAVRISKQMSIQDLDDRLIIEVRKVL